MSTASRNEPPGETPLRAYFLRAFYEWTMDNGFTPQVLIRADLPGVVVPRAFVKEERIVLKIHPRSVAALHMDNERLRFSARFAGRKFEVFVPVEAVLAIFCEEDGRGISFDAADAATGVSPAKAATGKAAATAKPAKPVQPMQLVQSNKDKSARGKEDSGRKSGGKPALKLIK